MDKTQLILIINEVIKIAKKASSAIMEIYAKDFEVEFKDDESPLTTADKVSNEIICEGLENMEHKFPIMSEETTAIEYSERKDYGYYWCVDPLDGTKEFVKKNGEFVVNIALIKDNYPILGVVATPALNEVAWAAKGLGAFLEKNGHTCKLKVNQFSMEDEGLRIVCSRSHINKDTKDYIDKLNNPQLVSKGSALKLIMIANGEAEIYPRLGPTMEWDIAAPQIIVEEAGGSVVTSEEGERLSYNKENLLNPYFIVSADKT